MIDGSKIIKYLVYGIIVYGLLILLPKEKMAVGDTITTMVVIVVSVVILDQINFCNKVKENFSQQQATSTIQQNTGWSSGGSASSSQFTPEDLDDMDGTPMLSGDGKYYQSNVGTPTPTPTTTTATTDSSSTTITGTIGEILESDGDKNGASDCIRNCTLDTSDDSDMKYSQWPTCIYQPLGKYDSTFTNDFEHGYSYLHTDKWRLPMPPIPKCSLTNGACQVCPVNTTGYPTDLKEWNASRKVLPPDNINIEYIKKLNSGCA